MPRNTPIFHPTFTGQGVVRSRGHHARIRATARWRRTTACRRAICRCAAISRCRSISRSGEVMGGLFFGHPDADSVHRARRAGSSSASPRRRPWPWTTRACTRRRSAKSPAASARKRRCAKRISARMNSSRRWRTSCAIRSRRSARPRSSRCPPSASEEQKRWSHEVITRQVRHMSLLLDDLLDISRITRGTLELRTEMTSLAAVVDAAVETSRPAHRSETPHVLHRAAADAGAIRGRSAAAGAGAVEPADERRQVHRPARHHSPARHGGRRASSSFPSPTPASGCRRKRCPPSSPCSPR